jgi:Uma2 family endonuclease
VIVTCGEERYLDDEFDTLQNPVLIIEVLSKTTQRYDRGEKFARYQTLPSLLEYVLVAQDEVRIEQWTRQPDERWLLTEFRKMEATIELASMAVSLPVAEIYEKVELPGPTS